MTGMQATLWALAAGALALALFAAWRERVRGRRHDLNRVGWIDWRTVQFAAFLAVLVLVGLALHPQ